MSISGEANNNESLPKEALYSFNQALTYSLKRNFEEAIELFSKLIEAYPNWVECYVNLGNVYFSTGKLDLSMQSWRKALDIDPVHLSCYTNIGNALYSQEKTEEAMMYWLKALSIAPDYTKASRNLGSAYEKLDDKFNAYKFYELYLRFHSDTSVYDYRNILNQIKFIRKNAFENLKIANHYQKNKEFRKAILGYKKSIELYPRFYQAYSNLGNIAYSYEQFDQACDFWKRALILEPHIHNTYFNVGLAYDRNKQVAKAYSYYKRYLNAKEDISQFDKKKINDRLNELDLQLPQLKTEINDILKLADDLFNKKKFDESYWEYQNYLILAPEEETKLESRIKEVKSYSDPIKKVSEMAYNIGTKCYANKDYQGAYVSFKRVLQLDNQSSMSNDSMSKLKICAEFLK